MKASAAIVRLWQVNPVNQRANLAIVVIIAVVGTIMSRLVRRYPASMPLWMPYEFSWVVYGSTALSLAWYFKGITQAPMKARPQAWRVGVFSVGVGLIYAAMHTQYDYAAQHMFFLHRAQHLVLHHLGPFLVALSAPLAMIEQGMPALLAKGLRNIWVERFFVVFQQPAIAAFLFVGLIYLWPSPPVHFFAMLDPRLYTVMNWSVTIDGFLFWSLILDPRPRPLARLSYGARLITCAAIMFPQILLGALITFCDRDLFEVYAICGRIVPMSALDDQHLGGLILWIPGAMMSIVAALVVLNFMRLNEEEQCPGTDEELSDHACAPSA